MDLRFCSKNSLVKLPNLANQEPPNGSSVWISRILAVNAFIQPRWRLAASLSSYNQRCFDNDVLLLPLLAYCSVVLCSSRGSLFLICQCCCLQYARRLACSKMSGFNGSIVSHVTCLWPQPALISLPPCWFP